MPLRTLLVGTVTLAAAAIALLLAYPWSVYVNFGFPRRVTLLSYLLISFAASVLAMTSFLIFCHGTPSNRIIKAVRSIGAGATVLGIGLIFCALFGPVGFDLPGTRVRGIFFAEWKFASFFFFIVVPVSVIVTMMSAICSRKAGLASTSSEA